MYMRRTTNNPFNTKYIICMHIYIHYKINDLQSIKNEPHIKIRWTTYNPLNENALHIRVMTNNSLVKMHHMYAALLESGAEILNYK